MDSSFAAFIYSGDWFEPNYFVMVSVQQVWCCKKSYQQQHEKETS